MKPFLIATCSLFLMTLSAIADQTSPELGIQEHNFTQLAFTGATIVVSPDRTIEDGILLINEGRIEAVGKNVTIPEGVTIRDISGMYIYPAFIDPISDYGMPKTPTKTGRDRAPKYIGDRIGGSAWNEAVHAEKNWSDQFKPAPKSLEEWYKAGYAVVQTAKLDGIFRGRSTVVLLRDGLPNDLVLVPYSIPFAAFNKGSSSQDYPSSIMGSIALMRQSFMDADWYLKARTVWNKHPDKMMPEFNSALVEIAKTAELSTLFDSRNTRNLIRGQILANEFGRHFIPIGSNHEYAYINDLKTIGVDRLILPLDFPDPPSVETVDAEASVTLAELRHWNTAPSNAAILSENNISFAFTTYHLKKKQNLLKQVRKTLRRGLPSSTALAALTTIPAEICDVTSLVGTLDKGKLANFLICDNDIFNNDGEVRSVWITGVEKTVKPIPEVDYRAIYNLTYNDRVAELHIEGTQEKLAGKIIVDADTLKLSALSFDRSRLHFSVKEDTTEEAGVLRFSGSLGGDSLFGTVISPAGQRFPFVANYIDTIDSKKEDPKEPVIDELLASITYPNRSYGLPAIAEKENVLFRNATVWTSDSMGVIQNADLLIFDGLIDAVGINLVAPKGVKVVDATGKHITAGIIDAHSHIAISGGVNEGTHAVTSEVRIGDVINPDDISIYRQLAGGVTSSLLLHGSANPIGGQTQVIKLRWGSNAEQLKFTEAAPTIKFALGENVKQSNWGARYSTRYPQTRMGVESIIRDAFRSALDYEKKRQDYQNLTGKKRKKAIPIRRDLQKETLLEILHGERLIHCHSYHQTEILMLMRLAEEFGFKIAVFTHILEGYKVAKEMAEHGAAASSFSDWWAYKFEVYDAIPQSPRLMTDAGLVVSINSDNAEMARRLNQEAAKSVMYAGMSQEEALKMVTINPAIQLRVDHLVGSLRKGKQADFVVWNDNPLSVYAHVEQTWIDGKRYFDQQRDEIMREQVREEKHRLIQAILTTGQKTKGKKMSGSGELAEPEYHCDDVFDYWKQQEEAGYAH